MKLAHAKTSRRTPGSPCAVALVALCFVSACLSHLHVASAYAEDPLQAILSRQPRPKERNTEMPIFLGEEGEYKVDREMSIGEHAEFMRRYCRANRKDQRCIEYPPEDERSKRNDGDFCLDNPLDKRCRDARTKALNQVYIADRLCKQDPNSRKCRTARKRVMEQ